jgi:methionyl aminopeptidase
MHVGSPGMGLKLQAGMTFTIEPMINQGKAAIRSITKNNWTIAVTADRRLSAQWEHTILVTETGFEILTLRDEEKDILSVLMK